MASGAKTLRQHLQGTPKRVMRKQTIGARERERTCSTYNCSTTYRALALPALNKRYETKERECSYGIDNTGYYLQV